MQAPVLVTPLKELCIKVVAANFESRPTFGNLPDAHVKKIIDQLPLDLPLELVGSVVTDESYWQRRACARWKNLEVAPHGNSWKQLYFERNLQDTLEKFDAEVMDLDDLRRLMTYSKRFVQSVTARQLPSHLDLSLIFNCMVTSPSSLSLSYGLRDVGMNYDRTLFGMKLADCRSLARSLMTTETLTYLDLSNNGIDDDKLRMLASGLVDNHTITHLCLAHNKIADRGIKALAKMLEPSSVVAVLDVHDNQIHTEGGKALARAIKHSQSLLCVNARLNRMGDEGCKAICEALRTNSTVERVNISANSAGALTAVALSALLKAPTCCITELDVSCNAFGLEGGNMVRKAVEQNTSLLRVDVRNSGMDMDDEMYIHEEMQLRQEKRERARVLGKA